ncbi:ABC transporter substrate-binding protein [Caldicellulosiruptoraceae bacterium PP1]
MDRKRMMRKISILVLAVFVIAIVGSFSFVTNKANAANAQKVEIKLASWGDESIKIKYFEKRFPNIKVTMDKSITWPWDEKLAAAAASGKLPDVFWLFNVPAAAANGWAEDLTPYLKADKDYNPDRVFLNVFQTSNYFGKQIALPHSMFAAVVMLNLDLFQKENIPVPAANWNLNDFRKAAIKLTKFSEKQFGVDGISWFAEMLPPQFNPNLGWKTYDGKNFHFDDPSFVNAYKWAIDLRNNDKVCIDLYPSSQQDKWYGKGKWAWTLGKVGMRIAGTWDMGWQAKSLKFKWDVRPLPGYKSQKIPLILDFVGMAKNSKHKKEAFEFIKYITYSKQGWMDRVNYEKASIPLVSDADVWKLYLSKGYVAPGMKDVLKLIKNDSFFDGAKWAVGWPEISWDMSSKIIDKFWKGQAKPEDVQADLQKRSSDQMKVIWDKLEAAIKKNYK